MVTRTFLDKSTTILKDSESNYGLNPICMLHYGNNVSRFLIHFDVDKIKENFGLNPDVKHILRMTNCASINIRDFDRKIPSLNYELLKKRATSFMIMAFPVPQEWHMGVGFDNESDLFMIGQKSSSTDGCNWYQSYNGFDWDEEGIYTAESLEKEHNKFAEGEDSIIIDRQSFDYGNENIELDITKYVNDVLSGVTENYGICLCVTPMYENETLDISNYVGFFNEKTNTFFEPVIESRLDDCVCDDRNAFYLNKENRLYLYSNIGGEAVKLDELPKCIIDGKEYDVTEQFKGVYYATVKLDKSQYAEDTILYDEWSNLKYNGEDIDDVEMEFVTLSTNGYYSFNTPISNDAKYSLTINGINDDEKLIQDDERLIKVIFRQNYTKSDYKIFKNAKYRLYVKDGDREIDVIDWDCINTGNKYNYFMIRTNELLPNTYHFDVKCKIGMENKLFKDVLEFKVVSNPTDEKR